MPKGRVRRAVLAAACLLVIAGAVVAGRDLLLFNRLEQARVALRERDGAAALRHLEAARRIAPDDPEVSFLTARAHRRMGRLDLVRTHLAEAWRLGLPVDRIRREEWLALAQSGQFRESEAQLPRLLTDPQGDGPEICEAFVNGYLLTYRFQEAMRLLDIWQADYPEDPQPHYMRGIYSEHCGQNAEAAESFRAALELAPGRRDIRMKYAESLLDLRRYDEAIGQIEHLRRETPDDPELLTGLGRCLVDQGKLDEAREAYDQALRLSPNHYGARLQLGQLELKAGRPEEALRWLEPVVAERPLRYPARFALASALQAAGRNEEAAAHFEYVAAAQKALARVRGLMDRLKSEPRNTELRYEVGTILLRYDAPAEGAGWLRSVLELDPGHRPTHAALAEYYASQANHELARRHRRLAETPDGPQERG